MLKFVMAIGVEGSGHSMLRSILSPMANNSKWLDGTEPVFTELRDSELVLSRLPSEWSLANMRRRLSAKSMFAPKEPSAPFETIIDDYCRNSVVYYMSPSYPFGLVDRSYMMPSVHGIVRRLERAAEGRIEWRFIFLNRRLVDCAKSCMRRNFNNDPRGASAEIHMAALHVEDALRYLRSRGMGFLQVDYEQAVKERDLVSAQIADYLELTAQEVDPGKITAPTESAPESEYLQEFFCDRAYEFHHGV